MRIVVLAGGLSTERDVSISSGIKVASALREKGNEVVLLDVFMGYEENFCDIDALFKHNYSFTDSLGVGTEIPDIKTVKENRLDKSSKFIGMNVIKSAPRQILHILLFTAVRERTVRFRLHLTFSASNTRVRVISALRLL